MGIVDDRLRQLRELEDRLVARDEPRLLRQGGGGGTSGDVSDDWKDAVDRRLTTLEGDVRKLLYALVGGFLLLAGGGWVVYDKLITASAVSSAKIDVLIERTTPRPPTR